MSFYYFFYYEYLDKIFTFQYKNSILILMYKGPVYKVNDKKVMNTKC